MTKNISLNNIYDISEDIVAREIEGELIIIPLVAGIGDLEDDLYTLNDTGKEIWNNLKEGKTLSEISELLFKKFKTEKKVIEKDIIGLITELEKRKMVKVRN